jgi:predicted nucleic acid-binding protein
MADYFFDSSALAKHYHAEVGSTKVEDLLAEAGARYLVSRLTVLELQSVFARTVRTRLITDADLELTRTRLLNEITQGQFQVIRITDFHDREAERLIRKYASTRNLRTLDALQLAVALDHKRRETFDYFVCADTALSSIAHEEGLLMINPEQP